MIKFKIIPWKGLGHASTKDRNCRATFITSEGAAAYDNKDEHLHR